MEDSSGIDRAFAEDSSGIKTVSGGYEPGEIESGIESGSRAGMFSLFLTNLIQLFPEFMAVQCSRKIFFNHGFDILVLNYNS